MGFDFDSYNELAMRVSTLETGDTNLTDHVRLHRWECWYGILQDALELDVLTPIMDLMYKYGHFDLMRIVKGYTTVS